MSKNNTRVTIIAEAGVNHNGSLELAMQLVSAAAEAGADIVKFQTFVPNELVTRSASKAKYQQKTTEAHETQQAMLQKLALGSDMYIALMEQCRKCGITFLSTPFDLSSVMFLHSLGMEVWKIPSGEITNLPYLRRIGKFGGKVILSTGMSTLEEVAEAVSVLEKSGTSPCDLYLLHCTTEYPASYDSVNLRAMCTLRDAFPSVAGVGYSDHTQGVEVPVAAVALGATIIEKHFTLDKNMEGPDHKASLEPRELAAMVQSIRHIESAMGDGIKAPVPVELENRKVARKSIVAARAISCGEVFTEENLTTKRPGTGMSPMLWDDILGKSASRDYAQDALLCEK